MVIGLAGILDALSQALDERESWRQVAGNDAAAALRDWFLSEQIDPDAMDVAAECAAESARRGTRDEAVGAAFRVGFAAGWTAHRDNENEEDHE